MKEIQIQDLPYEESYLGFDIYIEPNPDRFRDGFVGQSAKSNKNTIPASNLIYKLH